MLRKMLTAMILGASILAVGCSSTSVEKEEVKEEKTLRITSSTVAATQVMDKLGLDLVGVPSTQMTLPERYAGVQEIGQSFDPNFEVIASLTPDLLVFDNNFKEKVEAQVSQYGLNAFYFNTSTFTNFKESILQLGEITSKEKAAEELVGELQHSVDHVLEKQEKSKKDIKVAIVFGTSEGYMLATDKSYVGDLLNTINVANITDELEAVDSAYVNFSMEQIMTLNPDYILRLAHGDVEESKKAFEKEFAENPAWQQMDATKEGRVYDLDSTVFGVTANLSVSNAITELGNILYGE